MKFPAERPLEDFANDRFGYAALSKRILDEILLKMELPNCFGLYGNWGTGKSSILACLRMHLTASPENYRDTTIIYFEAWKYEYSEQKDLMFALLSEIKKQVGGDKKIWKQLLVDLTAVGAGVLRKLDVVNLEDTAADMKLIEKTVYQEHELWADKIDGFRKNFDQIVAKVLEAKKSKRMIIIVDDLDRCLPENAVKLLEGIKNFLTVPGALFVLAIDRRIISAMIEKKYGLHHGYGDEYLTKIIHYYYELPEVDLKSIVKDTLASHDVQVSERQISYIADFLLVQAREPRIVKHVLHQFGVAVSLSQDAQNAIMGDSTETELQYYFVASFLLTQFPSVFSVPDPIYLLRKLTIAARIARNGQQRTGELDEAMQDLSSINPTTRKKLESIMWHAIYKAGTNDPEKFIDSSRLISAIRSLRH